MAQVGYLIGYAAAGAAAYYMQDEGERNNDTTSKVIGWIIGGAALLSAFSWSPEYILISLVEIGIGVGGYHFIKSKREK